MTSNSTVRRQTTKRARQLTRVLSEYGKLLREDRYNNANSDFDKNDCFKHRAHVEEAQVRLVRVALRGEPLQEGDQRLAGRGRRVVGAARACGLAASHAGSAAVNRRRSVVGHGEGDARRPGAAQLQERPDSGHVRQPKWTLRNYSALGTLFLNS